MAQAKYLPFGNTLDISTAFIQAGTALDVAAKLATENRDQETMLNVALGWLELGRRLGYAREEESEGKEKSNDFGFSLNSHTETKEEVEQEDEESEDED